MKKIISLIIFCVPLFIIADDFAEKQQQPEWYKNFKAVKKQKFRFKTNKMAALFKILPDDVQKTILQKIKDNKIDIHAENESELEYGVRLLTAFEHVSVEIEDRKIYANDEYKRKALLKMWNTIKFNKRDYFRFVYKETKRHYKKCSQANANCYEQAAGV